MVRHFRSIGSAGMRYCLLSMIRNDIHYPTLLVQSHTLVSISTYFNSNLMLRWASPFKLTICILCKYLYRPAYNPRAGYGSNDQL